MILDSAGILQFHLLEQKDLDCSDMACKGKSVVIFSVVVLMVLIPLALYIVAIVAPLFYSSRSKLINKY